MSRDFVRRLLERVRLRNGSLFDAIHIDPWLLLLLFPLFAW